MSKFGTELVPLLGYDETFVNGTEELELQHGRSVMKFKDSTDDEVE